jgi:hypothetical protein
MIRIERVSALAEPLILSRPGRGESCGYALIQALKARFGGKLRWTTEMR